MSTMTVNGLTVEVSGEGPDLLCIHGLGGSSNTWTPVMPALAGFRVIRPDLPGSGRSPLGGVKLSIAAFVAALEGTLDALQVTAVPVVAHSLGTIVAQHLAVSRPALVRSLLLFGPLVAPPDAARANIEARARLARSGVAGMQEIADAIVSGGTSKETKQDPLPLALIRECIMRQPAEGYAQSCEALAAAQAAEIERIRVPTLLVTGDQDAVAPSANVALMAQRISGSRQETLAACGHWHTFEDPAGCMRQLTSFLQG